MVTILLVLFLAMSILVNMSLLLTVLKKNKQQKSVKDETEKRVRQTLINSSTKYVCSQLDRSQEFQMRIRESVIDKLIKYHATMIAHHLETALDQMNQHIVDDNR